MVNTIRSLIKVNGVDMSYIELGCQGQGDEVIILHGSFGNADIMKDYGMEYAKNNHVILLDLPGHFVSATQKFTDFEVLTTIIIDTIKCFKEQGIIVKEPILHGWSLGGVLILNIAAIEPSLLKEGIVLDCDCKWVNKVIPEFVSQEQFVDTFKGILKNPSVDVSQEVVDELVQQADIALCSFEVANADLVMNDLLDITDKLSDIEVPIRIVFGEYDFLSSVDRQEALAQSIKNARLYIIPSSMHQVCIEKPKYVHDLLAEK